MQSIYLHILDSLANLSESYLLLIFLLDQGVVLLTGTYLQPTLNISHIDQGAMAFALILFRVFFTVVYGRSELACSACIIFMTSDSPFKRASMLCLSPFQQLLLTINSASRFRVGLLPCGGRQPLLPLLLGRQCCSSGHVLTSDVGDFASHLNSPELATSTH